MTPLPYLLAFVLLATRIFFSRNGLREFVPPPSVASSMAKF